jgi:hypothetical protein
MSNGNPHNGLADKLTVVPTGSAVGAQADGMTPIVAGVPSRNVGLYANQAVTATVTFKDGTSIAAFAFVAGWHPLELRSVSNASIANALYWATQSQY